MAESLIQITTDEQCDDTSQQHIELNTPDGHGRSEDGDADAHSFRDHLIRKLYVRYSIACSALSKLSNLSTLKLNMFI